ncbi:unnamed protein product [Lymnaea stagnalis]|uniref:Riboflavin kinase n=1 Tax=Lymnaea stagnalis TaxID=6523 RepID=A0AAV2I2Q5_LYMST
MSLPYTHLPFYAEGTVVSGFGRGSKELGIPTANFPEDVVKKLPENFKCGVYYGLAKISSNENVFKMTMSVGWNPYYHNTVKTMETHIMHEFESDFYGDHLKIIVLGYIRDMLNFKSLEDLIKAIQADISESNTKLDESELLKYREDPFFFTSPVVLPEADWGSSRMVSNSNNAVDSCEGHCCPIDSNHVIPTSDGELTGHHHHSHQVDLAKTTSNGLVNGTHESCDDKEVFISNLKVKNSACCEQKLNSGSDQDLVVTNWNNVGLSNCSYNNSTP